MPEYYTKALKKFFDHVEDNKWTKTVFVKRSNRQGPY